MQEICLVDEAKLCFMSFVSWHVSVNFQCCFDSELSPSWYDSRLLMLAPLVSCDVLQRMNMEIIALALALIVDISCYGCRLARPCLKHKAYKHILAANRIHIGITLNKRTLEP